EDGARTIYGYHFPDGLRKNTDLPSAIITPTTKAEQGGHDQTLSPSDVTRKGLVAPPLWREVETAAMELFARGQQFAQGGGVTLADTTCECGVAPGGALMLIDGVHTPDSSRSGGAHRYEKRFRNAKEP